MKLTKITVEELRNDPAREYNQSVWNEKINSLLKMEDVQFYKVPKGTAGFDYDKFYSVYTIPEGIRLLNDFGYSSCLTSSAFSLVTIAEDGTVTTSEVQIGEKSGYIKNDKFGRRYMANQSRYLNKIFTTSL